ncbi:MAG: hypothetical protein AAB222_09165, partial [Candidatus Binatota bacterium]
PSLLQTGVNVQPYLEIEFRLTEQVHIGYCLPKKEASHRCVPCGRCLRFWNSGHWGAAAVILSSRWLTPQKEILIIFH